MTNKPSKYCQSFPCSNMAVSGTAYCSQHQPARAPKDTDPFYLSVQWRRFRQWYISNHALCEQCEREGLTVPAAMVDHVVELKDGGDRLSAANAQSLCWKCHGIKTATEKDRRKNHRIGSTNNRVGSTNVS